MPQVCEANKRFAALIKAAPKRQTRRRGYPVQSVLVFPDQLAAAKSES